MFRFLPAALIVVVIAALAIGIAWADEGESKSKYTIKEVMKKAHKGGLLKKVLGDDATGTFWMGASSHAGDGRWRWSSGESWVYAPGEIA